MVGQVAGGVLDAEHAVKYATALLNEVNKYCGDGE